MEKLATLLRSSLLQKVVIYGHQSFLTLRPGVNVMKKFPLLLTTRTHKLEHLPLETHPSKVLEFEGKARVVMANSLKLPLLLLIK
jgi:hypothetical protein